jgi:hypothetical protein
MDQYYKNCGIFMALLDSSNKNSINRAFTREVRIPLSPQIKIEKAL